VYDGSGSVVALTDGSGTTVDSWTYTPNGQTTQSGSVYEPWQFQGGYLDTTANQMQYHNGQRYYEAGMMNGHWTQQDPVDSPFQTHGWNGYAYAGGDPVNLSDPNGMLIPADGGAPWVVPTTGSLGPMAPQAPAQGCDTVEWGVAILGMLFGSIEIVGGTALATASAAGVPFSFGGTAGGIILGTAGAFQGATEFGAGVAGFNSCAGR
jgi:RHS repeat-associated protein